jgi:hypothetical protein
MIVGANVPEVFRRSGDQLRTSLTITCRTGAKVAQYPIPAAAVTDTALKVPLGRSNSSEREGHNRVNGPALATRAPPAACPGSAAVALMPGDEFGR